jgi:small-conductance mechanosensitive channel
VILRSKNFGVGDRISLGGVRGDVIQLGFIQTRILELGQPKEEPEARWVRARQFTGRIVTVANSRIFDEPLFNYTREFPVIWEEIHVTVAYDVDHAALDRVLLDSGFVEANPRDILSDAEREHIARRFAIQEKVLEPRVFYQFSERGLEATLRFIVGAHVEREAKEPSRAPCSTACCGSA